MRRGSTSLFTRCFGNSGSPARFVSPVRRGVLLLSYGDKSMKGLRGRPVNSRLADPLADEILRASDMANSGGVTLRFSGSHNLFLQPAPMEQAAGSGLRGARPAQTKERVENSANVLCPSGNRRRVVSKRSKGTLRGTPQGSLMPLHGTPTARFRYRCSRVPSVAPLIASPNYHTP